MAPLDPIPIQRAAGSALRSLRIKGAPPHRLSHAGCTAPLKPFATDVALVARLRARFVLAGSGANELLLPALADWRDAVGCADPLLLPANALGSAGEKHLIPIPMPSWCASLVEAGVLRLEGQPALDGPRVVQHAWLAVVREAELSAVECFPIVLAGRYGSGAAALRIHLAISPPFLSSGWQGNLCLRAGAQRLDSSRIPVRLWLGLPASPQAAPPGMSGETAVTWVMPRGLDSLAPGWPDGWPRWAVLRVREGRAPQALWELPALWRACIGPAPEAEVASSVSPSPGTLRLAVDVGSTSTVVVEEDSAAAGSVGAKLLAHGSLRPTPSGFRRLAGDAATAHRVGCAEHVLAPGGQLPTALATPTASALTELLRGSPDAADQVWLPQAPGLEDDPGPLFIDRFKSPGLLLLSDWLAQVPAAFADRAEVSRRLLGTFAYQIGRTPAAAHATPLVAPEGGRWTLRRPRLTSAEAILTFPECAFDTSAAQPFSAVFEQAGVQLCRGLAAAWEQASHRLVADPAAARAARAHTRDERHPIDAYVDFGGLTLQITVRVPHAPGRPAPFIRGSSTSYLLGGERSEEHTSELQSPCN